MLTVNQPTVSDKLEARILTVHQPYATLIWARVKLYETRPIYTTYRGELFIHASKKMLEPDERAMAISVMNQAQIDSEIKQAALQMLTINGAVICKTTIEKALMITKPGQIINNRQKRPTISTEKISTIQMQIGFWEHGHYAYKLSHTLSRLHHPVEMIGKQRLWRVPKDKIEALQQALLPF